MPVVAPVRSTTSFVAITCARRSALATSVLPVSSRALSEAAEPMTPTLIRISVIAHRGMNYLLLTSVFYSYRAQCFTHVPVPPASCQKPGNAWKQKQRADADSYRSRRHIEACEQFARNVIGCCHG